MVVVGLPDYDDVEFGHCDEGGLIECLDEM